MDTLPSVSVNSVPYVVERHNKKKNTKTLPIQGISLPSHPNIASYTITKKTNQIKWLKVFALFYPVFQLHMVNKQAKSRLIPIYYISIFSKQLCQLSGIKRAHKGLASIFSIILYQKSFHNPVKCCCPIHHLNEPNIFISFVFNCSHDFQ